MTKIDENLKYISNVIVSKNCYKKLKMISIDREITIQNVVQDILEKSILKKISALQSVEDIAV